MVLWLVRAGSRGEQEQIALEKGIVAIGWKEMPDLSKFNDRKDLLQTCEKVYPDAKKMRLARITGQLWDFSKRIAVNDLVALPLKTESLIAIGKIIGDYEYRQIAPHVMHIRKVEWIKKIPRSVFDQDLLYSLGAFSTVCQIQRNDAERRIKRMLEGKDTISKNHDKVEIEGIVDDKTFEIDVEEYSRDVIIKHVEAKFSGHGLSRIIESILKAQGYVTLKSEPGKDEGVDILAGSGPLGFNEPRICVQVKSSLSTIDVRVLRELRGVMQKVNANQGLLVSWGGFTKDAINEAKSVFFSIRLWDQGAILNEITKYYEQFDDELKAELPLKRIWTMVKETE